MAKNKVIGICDRTIEWCFYILAVAVTFSTSIVEITVSLMILAWAIKKLIEKDLSWLNIVPVRIILAYCLWTILSCVNSDYFSESFRGIFKIMEYSAVFAITAAYLWKETALRRFLYAAGGGVALSCVNGLFQYFTGTGLVRHHSLIFKDYMNRVSSSFVHPNDFGAYLLVTGIVFLSFVMAKSVRVKERLVFFSLFLLFFVNLFLTKSRGAWVSFSAAFLTLGALKKKRILAVFLAVLLAAVIFSPMPLRERIFDLTFTKGNTTWERLKLWEGTINMIKEHPVLGFGINTYSRNFPRYRPEGYIDVRYPHNSYLHMASEIGIVGALIFLVFLGAVFLHSLRGISLIPPGMRKDVTTGLFASLIGFSLNCAVDTHLYSVNLAVFFHMLLGFCFALSCHARGD